MDDYKSLMIKSEEVSLILEALEDLLYKTVMDMNKISGGPLTKEKAKFGPEVGNY